MTMEYYIGQQPELFNRALTKKEQIAAPFADLYAQVQPDVVYLIASGTSRNAALAARPLMEWALNTPVTVLAPSCAVMLPGKKPLCVYISQGGNSTNTIAAIERFPHIPALALTGNPDGRVNTLCAACADIPCGEEKAGPKTKGYTMTILALYMMALETALQTGSMTQAAYQEVYDALTLCGQQYAQNLALAKNWVVRNADSLCTVQAMYLAGKRQGAHVAEESALKLLETVLIPATGYEFEEYLHGPTCSLDARTAGFYLLPVSDDEDYERMQKLIRYHRSVCTQVYTVGLRASQDPRDCVLLNTGKWYTQPFEQILPIQYLSAMLPEKMNLDDIGHQRFVALDEIMGVKYKPTK